MAVESAGDESHGDVHLSVSDKTVDPASKEELTAARTGGSSAASVRLCSGTVPANDMRCRTVCFMRAAGSSDQPAEGHAGPAGVECCILPQGPTLGSLQQARRLGPYALLSPRQLRRRGF